MASEFFRASAGAVVADAHGRVLVARRADVGGHAWQFPQGGIHHGESPLDAIYREIEEELGIAQTDVELLREHDDWLTYELPTEHRSQKTGRGQTQRWFLFLLRGDPSSMRVDEREFDAWRWMPFEDVVSRCVPFRRTVYEALLRRFKGELSALV